ncbi:hypothetical protein [Vibrio parahaemolyticus]|uniref:hypothetical protein n=1 Tax=Vibrio parahaemolyticus TaxID=670 RepID=UPI003D8167CC
MSNLQSWLKSQLTRTKRNTEAWTDFAHALGSLLESHVENYLERIKTRNSLFDMQPQDLQVEIRELGDFFAFGDVAETDLPMTVMQRQDQIHLKKTVYPLEATLRREFAGMEVTWQPLYAPTDLVKYPYGTVLVTADDLDMQENKDWFMTSRGVIQVPLNEVRVNDEESLREFEEKLRRVVYPLVPLRIVMQGTSYYLKFELWDVIEWVVQGISQVDTAIRIEDLDDVPKFIQKITLDWFDEDKPRAIPTRQAQTRLDAYASDTFRVDKNFFVYEKVWRTFLTNALESSENGFNKTHQTVDLAEKEEQSKYTLAVEAGKFTTVDKPQPIPQKQARTRLDCVSSDTVRLDKNFFIYEKLWRVVLSEKRPQIENSYAQVATKMRVSDAIESADNSIEIQARFEPKEIGLRKPAGVTSVRLDESPVDSVRLDRYV